jgi:hypothetical protein
MSSRECPEAVKGPNMVKQPDWAEGASEVPALILHQICTSIRFGTYAPFEHVSV